MNRSEGFTRAAESIGIGPFTGSHACTVLNRVFGDFSSERRLYESYFKPEDVNRYYPWYGETFIEENQLARQLSLLLMAEITKDLK